LLCAAVQEHGKDVVVDLEGVIAIDAAGIGALLSLQAAGIYLRLVSPTEPVREALRLTGLEKVFEVLRERSSEDGARDFASAELYIGESKVAALC
jgi:anti-anti-sigma factor